MQAGRVSSKAQVSYVRPVASALAVVVIGALAVQLLGGERWPWASALSLGAGFGTWRVLRPNGSGRTNSASPFQATPATIRAVSTTKPKEKEQQAGSASEEGESAFASTNVVTAEIASELRAVTSPAAEMICAKEGYVHKEVHYEGRVYLAACSPTNATPEHWDLIFAEKTRVIVDLVEPEEGQKGPNIRYWPSEVGSSIQFAGAKVTLESEQVIGDGPSSHRLGYLVERHLLVEYKGETLRIRQLHCRHWNDVEPYDVVRLRQACTVLDGWLDEQSRPLIHCHAGRGRTAAFIQCHGSRGAGKAKGVTELKEEIKNFNQRGKIIPGLRFTETDLQFESVEQALLGEGKAVRHRWGLPKDSALEHAENLHLRRMDGARSLLAGLEDPDEILDLSFRIRHIMHKQERTLEQLIACGVSLKRLREEIQLPDGRTGVHLLIEGCLRATAKGLEVSERPGGTACFTISFHGRIAELTA